MRRTLFGLKEVNEVAVKEGFGIPFTRSGVLTKMTRRKGFISGKSGNSTFSYSAVDSEHRVDKHLVAARKGVMDRSTKESWEIGIVTQAPKPFTGNCL